MTGAAQQQLHQLAEAARLDLAGFERSVADGDTQLAQIYAENILRWMGHAVCTLRPIEPRAALLPPSPHRLRVTSDA